MTPAQESIKQPNTTQSIREKILIVDDDDHIREVINFSLIKGGYQTCEAADGRQCLQVYDEQQPDLVILDILMPELDGTEVCKILRKSSSVPIIFLSSQDDEIDRIIGLELGGDDYITKPFSPRELLARVKAVLRRAPIISTPQENKTAEVHSHGCLLLNQERFQVFWDGKEIVMTAIEFAILQTLMSNPGRVYSRDELMERAYEQATIVTDRTIDSHIRKMRQKFRNIDADPIQTIRGIGYKLGPCI